MNTQILHIEFDRQLKSGDTLCRITENIKADELLTLIGNGYPITIVSTTDRADVITNRAHHVVTSSIRLDVDPIDEANLAVLTMNPADVTLQELGLLKGSALIEDVPTINPDRLYLILPAEQE